MESGECIRLIAFDEWNGEMQSENELAEYLLLNGLAECNQRMDWMSVLLWMNWWNGIRELIGRMVWWMALGMESGEFIGWIVFDE